MCRDAAAVSPPESGADPRARRREPAASPPAPFAVVASGAAHVLRAAALPSELPGAYPGIGAEERGQAEAIATNLFEMSSLKVPIISVVIGEGASGGALGIGVGDRVYMMENTWYTVISPESCSSILWRSWEYKEQAAAALKLTGTDMKRLKLIDAIIKEPVGGAHTDREGAFKAVEKQILSAFDELKDLTDTDLVIQRMDKYAQMGVYKE